MEYFFVNHLISSKYFKAFPCHENQHYCFELPSSLQSTMHLTQQCCCLTVHSLIVFIADFFPWHRTSSVPICAPNFVLSIWTKIGSEPEKVCSQLEPKIAGFPRPTVWTKVSVSYSILLLIKQLKKRWLCSKQMNRTGTGAHLVGNFALLLFHSGLWLSRAQHDILLNVK